ncbi:hypothetical protein GHT06_013892 [Daphnia sinensis]|uniref:Uncharacterized protein n=1 Tax=Daphnia sinensis TaxID=1820382 RepID=A0AAD5LBY5_9CRUS|nr:hypothetical protein GHT06_013892 [Daphnia sinensis]
MSDVGDSNGKPSGHGHWQGGRKSTADSAKVPAVLLALTGAAIVAIQTYVFITFPGDTYDFSLLCNGMAMASGSVSLLAGILCLCCVSSKRSSSALGFSVFMNVLAAIGAIGSTAVTVMETSRIDSEYPKHPCTLTPTTINCSLWFDLEIAVAVLSGVNFILALTMIILISMGMRRPKVRDIHHEPPVDVQRRAASIRETTVPAPQPEEIIAVPVVVTMKETPAEVAQPSSEEEEEEEEEETQKESVGMSRGPFIEQLKMMSREELERRLGEHMQHQFLEDLRQELSRRNLIPINGRLTSSTRSPTSSSSRVSSQPVPAPKPDYYQEPLGYNKEERF